MSSNAISLAAQLSFIQKQSKPENWNDGNTFHAGLSTPYVHCLQWKGKKATVMPHRKYHGFSVYYVLTEQDALQKITLDGDSHGVCYVITEHVVQQGSQRTIATASAASQTNSIGQRK